MGTFARTAAVVVTGLALAACGGTEPGATPAVSGTTGSPPASSPATAGALPWPEPAASALPPDRAAAMLAEMQSWVDKGLVPGATAAVVSPGGTWSAAVGVDGQGKQLQGTSGMALGHLTQTFVAAEALLLAEQGKLDLDIPASTYVPIRQLDNGATMRQLLAQRSGVPDPGAKPYVSLYTEPDAHWSTAKALAPVPKSTATPGGGFSENAANYLLAGLVIDKVTGLSTAAAIDGDLWAPLGLKRLAYQDEQTLPEPIAAPGEDVALDLPDGSTGRPYLPFRSWASATAAAQGVAGDAVSVARWGYALYGAQVLTPQSVSQLTDFGKDGYGLATVDFTNDQWFKWTIDGYGIPGGVPGYRSALVIYPEQPFSLAILIPSGAEALPYVHYLVNAGHLLS